MNSMHKEIVISRLTAWLVALLAVWLTACSDEEKHEVVLPPGTPVTAHFCLSAANSGITTRAGEVEENMKSWVVIITNKSNGTVGTVENVFTKDNVGNLTEVVVANFTTQVTTGTKRIYSFANITLEELIKAINPEIETIDDPIETIKSINNISEAIAAATFLPKGNNWTSANNTKGIIPMSNWQDIEIKSDNKSYTLYVCRMIAKVEFKLENKTGQNITVKNVTISDITSNESPVMLMPKTSVTAERDIKQSVNLPMASDSASVSVETTEVKALKEDGTDAITLPADTTTSVTVYVNESQVQSDYGLFRLTLTIDRGTGEEEELRYALLSDESSNWTWIARNDHRIIPITIDDYKLDLVPVDFPPIGVYPASVKEDEEGTFTCTFHAGGNFHLAPVVTRYSTGESLPYGWGGNEVGTWNITSFTTPEKTPAGETNTKTIYTTATPLSWNGKDPMLTGEFNNSATGEAYHELTVTVNKGNGVTQTLLGRIWVKLAEGSN